MRIGVGISSKIDLFLLLTKKDAINEDDLISFIKGFNTAISKTEAYLILKRFDVDKDGKITFKDFVDILTI